MSEEKTLIVSNGKGTYLSGAAAAELAAIELQYQKLTEQRKAFSAKLAKEMENRGMLKLKVYDHQTGTGMEISYITSHDRESFDTKRFRDDHPELYDDYVEMKPIRSSVRIKITEKLPDGTD